MGEHASVPCTEENGIGTAPIMEFVNTVQQLRQTRTVTGNKEHASVPCTEGNGIGMAIMDIVNTIRRLRQTRTLTGNKENTNVIHPEEVGIGMAIKDGATTIRRLPTQATIGLHRTQGTPATIRRLPTQATIRPQPTPIPPQNTMATIAKQINAAATGHSLRMEFVYRRTRVSWTHAARNARNGDGHAKHLAQQTERTATFKNNMAHEQIEL